MQPSDYRLLHEFRYEIRKFLAFSEQAARSAGIEPQQHQILLALKGGSPTGALSVGEIAERLQVRHNTAVELVNRTADRGFVARQLDPGDRRRVSVSLTLTGEALLEQLSQAHLEELRRAASSLVPMLEQMLQPASAEPAIAQ